MGRHSYGYFTPARQQALKKAQMVSAYKRRGGLAPTGSSLHDISGFHRSRGGFRNTLRPGRFR